MAEYYKHEIAKWNVATDDLTLEQEAAYHRVVATIRLYERPFRHNLRVLCGLWRCNERKAKRLLDELIAAEKLTIVDGFIIDEKAVDDASTLRQSRVDKASAGRAGGIESGKSRRKSLEDNDTGEALASTREEKRREENIDTKANALDGKPVDFAKAIFENGVKFLCGHGADEAKARSMIGKWRKSHPDREIFDALAACNKAEVIDPIPWITAKLTPPPSFTFDLSKFGETAQ